MKTRCLFLVFIILLVTSGVAAQTKSITNADLESYRQQRLDNENFYRENYERLGMPSPEEIDRRNAVTAKEMAELSAKLRAEEAERERIRAEHKTISSPINSFYRTIVVDRFSYVQFYGVGHYWNPRPHGYVQPGYFAGGAFWPTGSATPSQPVFAPHRSR